MTLQEKIETAETEVKEATNMLEYSRKNVADWEHRFELRVETLAALQEQAKPAKRKKGIK